MKTLFHIKENDFNGYENDFNGYENPFSYKGKRF